MNLYRLFEWVLNAEYVQLPENAASYFAELRGDTLYLLFEKSNGATDWKNNFDFPVRPYREMEDIWFVHRGFLRVFKSIAPNLHDQIMDERVKHILIAGYSHGAAIALLCHEYCVYHRPDLASEINGYGYGCPRVIWGILNSRMLKRFERFTVVKNCRDLITRLPPVLFGFRHVGTILQIGVDAPYGAVLSHTPESYLAELKKPAGRREV